MSSFSRHCPPPPPTEVFSTLLSESMDYASMHTRSLYLYIVGIALDGFIDRKSWIKCVADPSEKCTCIPWK